MHTPIYVNDTCLNMHIAAEACNICLMTFPGRAEVYFYFCEERNIGNCTHDLFSLRKIETYSSMKPKTENMSIICYF